MMPGLRYVPVLGAVCFALTGANLLLKGPESAQVAVGEDALFTCVSTIGTFGYKWEENGILVSVGNPGFSITVHVSSHSASNSSLTVHTSRGNFNQTAVRCIIYDDAVQAEYSPFAFLLLQGLLAPPVNVSMSQVNCSAVTVWWSAPFSLPDVPILGYVINMTNLTAGNQLSSELVLGAELSWTVSISSDHQCPGACNQLVLSMAAVNEVGEGEAVTITFSPVQVPVLSELSYEVEYVSPNELILSVIAQISVSCLGTGSILTWLTLACDINGNSSIAKDYTVDLSQPSAKTSIVMSISNFPENDKCQSNLFMSNVAGVVESERQSFSTYDVQTISLSSTSRQDTSVSCHFLLGSPAQGCLVEFNCTRTGLTHTVQLQKTPAETTATVTFSSLEACLYTISVFDVEADGSISQFAAIVASFTVTEAPDTLLQTVTASSIPKEFPADTLVLVIAGSSFVAVLIIVAVVGVCFCVCWKKCCKGSGEIETRNNPAYESVIVPAFRRNATPPAVMVDGNPAYESVSVYRTVISARNNTFRQDSIDSVALEEGHTHQYEDVGNSTPQYATIH